MEAVPGKTVHQKAIEIPVKYGEIKAFYKKLCNKKYIYVEWKLPEFFSMPKNVGESYSSSGIVFFNTQLYLSIYPNGNYETEEWIELQLNRDTFGKPIRFTVGIKKIDGSKEEVERDQRFPDHHMKYLCKFLKRSDLLSRKSQLAPADALTVTCTLWIDKSPSVENIPNISIGGGRAEVVEPKPAVAASKDIPNASSDGRHLKVVESKPVVVASKGKRHLTQTQDVIDCSDVKVKRSHLASKEFVTLQKHFKDLLLLGDDHDMIIKVKHKEYKAHKNILRARSPIFAAIFKHELEENMNSLSIEDCDPEDFGEFLQYVYTGEVENLSTSNAGGLYYLGDKYDFSGLKEMCIEVLTSSLSVTNVCAALTLATNHSEPVLLQHSISFFAKYLEEILMTVEWQNFLISDPIKANQFCIKAVRILKKN